MKVGMVCFSQNGHTSVLAEACCQEMRDLEVDTYSYRIKGEEIVQGRFTNKDVFANLANCDAIVFASPTYMGGVAAQFKAFVDATSDLWTRQEWAGKYAAGITSGSSLNGDQSTTLLYLITFANQHGMLWIGLDAAHGFKDHGINRLGCQLGVSAETANEGINEIDLESARYLGSRIVRILFQASQNRSNV